MPGAATRDVIHCAQPSTHVALHRAPRSEQRVDHGPAPPVLQDIGQRCLARAHARQRLLVPVQQLHPQLLSVQPLCLLRAGQEHHEAQTGHVQGHLATAVNDPSAETRSPERRLQVDIREVGQCCVVGNEASHADGSSALGLGKHIYAEGERVAQHGPERFLSHGLCPEHGLGREGFLHKRVR